MKAGGLKTRVVIEQQSATPDALGQPTNTWTTVATVWADIRHQRGMEMVKAEMLMSKLLASIRIRYRTDITPNMRVKQGSTIYNIRAVSPDANNRDYIDLLCEKYE